ncbi:hypothetical protein NBRC116602_29880 [Hyphomicrobiales bacterium 4NK60-0047b]
MRNVSKKSYLIVFIVSMFFLPSCSSIESYHALSIDDEIQSDESAISYSLPKNTVTAVLTQTDGKYELTLSKNTTADDDLQFHAKYDRNIFYHDKIALQTTSDGFLETISNQTIDKTPDITEKISKIFLTTLGKSPFSGSLRTLPSTGLENSNTIFTYEFDPFIANDLTTINKFLQRKPGYCIAIFDNNRNPLPGSCLPQNGRIHLVVGSENSNTKYTKVGKKPFSGVFHRRKRQYYVVVFKRKLSRWEILLGVRESFFNASPVEKVALGRGAFIDQKQTLTFSDGVLTKYDIDKPSEMLGFVGTLSIIVNAAIQIPGLQTQALTNENTNFENRLNAREKRLDLKEKELALKEREQNFRSLNRQQILDIPKSSELRNETILELKKIHDRNCEDAGGNKQFCEDEWKKRIN